MAAHLIAKNLRDQLYSLQIPAKNNKINAPKLRNRAELISHKNGRGYMELSLWLNIFRLFVNFFLHVIHL